MTIDGNPMIPQKDNSKPSQPPMLPPVPTFASQKATGFLIWKALAALMAFDLLGMGRNFARIHRLVQEWRVSEQVMPADTVDRVCAAVNYACVWYPKRVLCFQRSAVTTCLLRSCGIAATMVLGVQNWPFKAHAWTEVDGRAVNERKNVHEIYSVLERC